MREISEITADGEDDLPRTSSAVLTMFRTDILSPRMRNSLGQDDRLRAATTAWARSLTEIMLTVGELPLVFVYGSCAVRRL